jgi:hypothetical protein
MGIADLLKMRIGPHGPLRRDPSKRLTYAATARCPCGAGLAHGLGADDHWDCSEILLGTADQSVQHTAKLPFTFYEIKSENGRRGTTRPA